MLFFFSFWYVLGFMPTFSPELPLVFIKGEVRLNLLYRIVKVVQ